MQQCNVFALKLAIATLIVKKLSEPQEVFGVFEMS